MTEYYVAKLNLKPTIIGLYTENDKNKGINQLMNYVIPSSLIEVFNKYDYFSGEDEIYLFDGNRYNEDIQLVLMSPEFEELQNAYSKLLDEYKKVIENSEKNNGIFWPNEYLKHTKSRMKRALWSFRSKFPNIIELSSNLPDDKVDDRIPGNSNYGHGRKYLFDVEKIFYVIDSKKDDGIDQLSDNIRFFYEKSSEKIYIESIITVAEFKEELSLIQNRINSSGTNIGKVTINPIYDEVILNKSYNSVTFQIVYPNNSKRRNNQNRVLDKVFTETHSDSMGVKMNSDGESNFTPGEIKSASDLFGAKDGYLKSVRANGKKLNIEGVKKIVKKFIKKQ
ncbi:hypothetical protein [Companilactobacillus sp. HBUAS59699]|uniref:hypothetical protein n=1 Tax=Companilactobacillus sp. HBUAS59699 TaxID=3109358 RepID=UPI002FF037F8